MRSTLHRKPRKNLIVRGAFIGKVSPVFSVTRSTSKVRIDKLRFRRIDFNKKMRSIIKKNLSNPLMTLRMVRVGRLELPASCSQRGEKRFFYIISVCFVPFPLRCVCFPSLSKTTVSMYSTPRCG